MIKKIRFLGSNLDPETYKRFYNITLEGLNNLRGYTKHFRSRVEQKKLPLRLCESIARGSFKVIEINISNYKADRDIRVIIKSNNSYKGYNLLLVISLKDKIIVTGWKNSVTDKHAMLKKELYANA